jgi:hypothetical protein
LRICVFCSMNLFGHLHCTENTIYVFPEIKLDGLISNSYINVSVRDLYIPMTVLPIWLQQNRQADLGRQNIIILFWK